MARRCLRGTGKATGSEALKLSSTRIADRVCCMASAKWPRMLAMWMKRIEAVRTQ